MAPPTVPAVPAVESDTTVAAPPTTVMGAPTPMVVQAPAPALVALPETGVAPAPAPIGAADGPIGAIEELLYTAPGACPDSGLITDLPVGAMSCSS